MHERLDVAPISHGHAAPSPKPAEASSSQAADSSAQKTPGQKAMVDFFTAIEEEQQTMFNPQTNRYVHDWVIV